MIQQSFVGKTGYVAFNERGNRVNAEYEVIKLLSMFSFTRSHNSTSTFAEVFEG